MQDVQKNLFTYALLSRNKQLVNLMEPLNFFERWNVIRNTIGFKTETHDES